MCRIAPAGRRTAWYLLKHRTAPGHADAQPGHKSVRIVQGDGQSVESQEPEEEQWSVRLGDGGNRHPEVAGGVEGQGRENPGPRAVEPRSKTCDQPRRTGEEDDEAHPQAEDRERVASQCQAQCADESDHRRMVKIAQRGVLDVLEVIRLIKHRPHARSPDQP